MTEVCNMKQVFSCSDFLNDLWQNNPEAPDTLPGLPSPSEGGSTQLGRERSTDMLNLLGVAEDTDSMSNPFGPFTATSTSQRDSAGVFALSGEPGNSGLFTSQLSANQSLLQDTFMHQPASSSFTRGFDAQEVQPQSKRPRILEKGAFSMDTAKQARAICHNGMSITALQRQLQELKGTSGLDSFIQCNPPSMPTAVQESGSARGLSMGIQGSVDSAGPSYSPLAKPTTNVISQQPQLGLQQHQLRQLAQLLGSANVSALQSLAAPSPSAAAPDLAGSNARVVSNQLQECATSSAPGFDHSSGDDDTGALGDLDKLTGLGDDTEEPWESKLDKSLPPPEMKRMRRMLSNRESARRSRRRKQAHMQDLEVQNQELVDVNEKLQKEVAMLRNMAKEAIVEKKKSQAALEAFKHQVVHVLGAHNISLAKDAIPQEQAQQAAAATADSAESEAMQLVVKTAASGSPTSLSAKPVVSKEPATGRGKPSAPQTNPKLPKAPTSPGKAGSKRKTCEA